MSIKPIVLSLEVDSAANAKPVPLSQNLFSSDRMIIICDEINSTIWVWLGKNRSIIDKTKAQRAADAIKNLGYSYDKYKTIGMGLKLTIIDESKLNSNDVKDKYDTLCKAISSIPQNAIILPVASLGSNVASSQSEVKEGVASQKTPVESAEAKTVSDGSSQETPKV